MSQLFSHMSINNLLEPYQSAYKPHHGTETTLKNDILRALDNTKGAYLVLLDLSAIFDRIDFDVLTERLPDSLGINGTVRSWVMSYHQGRNRQVSIACILSKPQTMDFGLPVWSATIHIRLEKSFKNITSNMQMIHNFILNSILAYLETASLHFLN